MPIDRSHMLPQLHHGMDHQHYDWNPFNKNRAVLRWPENARIALCVIVNLEQVEWQRPEGGYQSPSLAGYGGGPFPDVTGWSGREYGHRVGFFRVMDVLDKHGIKATVAMDTLTADNYPFLVRECRKRGCEVIGHGISLSRMITSNMPEQEEREYIQTSLASLTKATGQAPLAGWARSLANPPGLPSCWLKPAFATSAIGPTTTSPFP